MLKPLNIMLLAPALITGCIDSSPTPPTPPELRPLIEAMSQRLEIANDVALSKFYSGKAVQDSERERQVIANVESQASAYLLDKDDVREFMVAQIEANKMVQYARIAQWHEDSAPQRPVATLTNGIRTRLDALQPILMQQYAAFKPWRTEADCHNWVETEVQRRETDPTLVTALQHAASALCQAHTKA